jgi:acyl-CoA synthetase (AMP-forming)/AMP-acid ligase II
LPNWVEAVAWQFAAASLGASVLGINTRYSVHELEHLLDRGDPVGLVLPSEFHALDFQGRLRAAAAVRRGREPWVAVARAAGEVTAFDIGGGAWPAPLPDSRARSATARPVAAGDDLCTYFTTSGSTGAPKLAGHDQAAVVRHARHDAVALGLEPGDAMLCVLPLSGVFGFNTAMATLAAAATCVLEPVFDPETALESMQDTGVSHIIGGDDMLGRIMDAWDDRHPLPRFRRGGIADFEGRSEAVARWAEEKFDARISGLYGSSELFALAAIWPGDLELPDRIRGGGAPVAEDIEVRAVHEETRTPLPAGETGELEFRGYNVIQAYLNSPGAAAAAFDDEGWFRSGDLGFMTGRGHDFVYVCRAGDALRLRGFLVEPAEIEQFLMSHPAVSGARVVGVRAGAGDIAVGFVTLALSSQVEEEELVAFCKERLARFKVPARILVLDEFPVTTGTNGTKIKTAALRERAAEVVQS